MYKLIDNILTQFRSCFKRNSTFANFVIIVIGMLLRKEFRGVSSIVSSLRLKPQCYDDLIHFFRSTVIFFSWTEFLIGFVKGRPTYKVFLHY
jgi:hypothetical protein